MNASDAGEGRNAETDKRRADRRRRAGTKRLKLFLRRVAVFIGAVSAWLIAFVIFDFANRRLPLFLAAAATYGVGAHVVLPRAVRIGARILQRGRVPSYTLTGDGLPRDPVNIALIGAYRDLTVAFAKLGWGEADKLSLMSSLRMAKSFLLDRSYPAAPFSTLYPFDRGQASFAGQEVVVAFARRNRDHRLGALRAETHQLTAIDRSGRGFVRAL